MKILVLGGTREARELAAGLDAQGHGVITSLAGRTEEVAPIAGEVRSGGFGGPNGLLRYLIENAIDILIDATHPFAAEISKNAVTAADETGLPLIRLCRPAWERQAGDNWVEAGTLAKAAHMLPFGAHILLTTGHRDLDCFVTRTDCSFIVRLIEKPVIVLPDNFKLILSRPPYPAADEEVLMRAHAITHLVTKNAGGTGIGKLQAARALGIQVIMIARPVLPEAHEVASVQEALAGVQALVS